MQEKDSKSTLYMHLMTFLESNLDGYFYFSFICCLDCPFYLAGFIYYGPKYKIHWSKKTMALQKNR